MAQNSSTGSSTPSSHNEKIIIVQVLVGIFLYLNCLMIFTFFKKEVFRTNVRYILFAHILVCDSLLLFLTDMLLLLSNYYILMPLPLCMCIYMLMSTLKFSTPLTLMAMSVERYVAICLPLRHSEISTPSKAIRCIPIIHSLSTIQLIIIISIFIYTAPPRFYSIFWRCNEEVFIVRKWQRYVWSAISQLYFVVMSSVIVFTYVKIMSAARQASTDKKKSANKGLRTVALHAFQLLLCLIQLWTPFVETAVMETDYQLFRLLRYLNYITFILAPRCLSPLVYGLRDEKFFMVLKYYALCGSKKQTSPASSDD